MSMQWIVSDTPQEDRGGPLRAMAGRTAETRLGADAILRDPEFLASRQDDTFTYGLLRGEPVRVWRWHADLYAHGTR